MQAGKFSRVRFVRLLGRLLVYPRGISIPGSNVNFLGIVKPAFSLTTSLIVSTTCHSRGNSVVISTLKIHRMNSFFIFLFFFANINANLTHVWID